MDLHTVTPKPPDPPPLVWLCAALRAQLTDMSRCCRDAPVRAPVVQAHLARVLELVAKIEEHGARERASANDTEARR